MAKIWRVYSKTQYNSKINKFKYVWRSTREQRCAENARKKVTISGRYHNRQFVPIPITPNVFQNAIDNLPEAIEDD